MNSATSMTRQQGKVLVYITKGKSKKKKKKKKKCSHEAKSCNTSNTTNTIQHRGRRMETKKRQGGEGCANHREIE